MSGRSRGASALRTRISTSSVPPRRTLYAMRAPFARHVHEPDARRVILAHRHRVDEDLGLATGARAPADRGQVLVRALEAEVVLAVARHGHAHAFGAHQATEPGAQLRQCGPRAEL